MKVSVYEPNQRSVVVKVISFLLDHGRRSSDGDAPDSPFHPREKNRQIECRKASVTVGHTRFNGFLYVNKPRQCSKCGRFGHANSVCNKKERCSRCDGKHQHDTCDAEVPWRPNCKKQHEATSHQFSVYETARNISTYQSANNVDYRSARSVAKPSSVKAQSSECDLHPRQSKNL